jgi:hypothetical protein
VLYGRVAIGMSNLTRLKLFFATLLCTPLLGTTLEQLSLDEMIQKSTGIVRVRIVSSYTAARGSDLYTYYRLETSETWKGPKLTEIAVPGGALRGARQSVSGAPQLNAGEEYLLFLWTGKSGLTQVIGLMQGVFQVRVDASGTPLVLRASSTEPLLDHEGQPAEGKSLRMRLTEMKARVSRALATLPEAAQ